MKLTIHRGTHEIGGSCVEVTAGSTRIVVDVGLPLEKPGVDAACEDALANERIAAVFKKSPPVAAVLLSHAHLDHSGLLGLVPASVPVYCSEGTSMMMEASSKYARQKDVPAKRILKEREPQQIGNIQVTGHPVDHSVFGSMALELEADGQRVLYSGDFRLHGRKPGMVEALAAWLSGKTIDVLLIEGTHISDCRSGPTEEALEETILADIKSAPGLVLASFSPPNVDRLVGFYKAARDAHRILALDHYAGFVLQLVSEIAKVPPPSKGNNIAVFRPQWQKLIPEVERYFEGAQISIDEVVRNPLRYVMLFRPTMLARDFSGGLPKGVRCIYSFWSGYLDEEEWRSTRSQINLAGGDLIERHTSGHIFRDHLPVFLGQIKYRRLIPMHTEAPEEFERLFQNVRLLADGEELDLSCQPPCDDSRKRISLA